MKFLCFIICLDVLSTAYGYHILAVQDAPSLSHYNLMKGLVRPLLEGGHKVTLITLYPEKKPVQNLTILDVSYLQRLYKDINVMEHDKITIEKMKTLCANITSMITRTPEVREALTKETFDAVMTEWFFTDAEAGYAAALQVPWILLYNDMSPHMGLLVDTVRSIPTIPMMMNDAPIPMNLWERMKNTMWYGLTTYGFLSHYSTEEKHYEDVFGPIADARGVPLPPFSGALHNISLLFLNSHPTFTPAQVLPPNAVEIGGYHIDENIPPLPKDLQELLDNSPNGVIYFSLGSVIKSKLLPDQTKYDLIKLFGELPYTVLWKFEEEMENLPKNLHIRPWMPQPSILNHPNVKVFITQGGALSTIESLRFRVPIIAIPVFGDQPSNVKKSVNSGRALRISFSPNMADELRVALKEMFSNASYYQKAQHLSTLFNSRPISTKTLIQNYVKLVIATGGAYHLRSKAQLYKWYETWMLDQVAILLAVLLVLYVCVKKIVSLVMNVCARTKVQKKE